MNFILPLPRRKRLQRTTLLFAFFLGFISLGFSQGNFNSNASGNWTTVGTWSLVSGVDGDGIPDANDVVTILNTHTVFVSDGTATPSTHACSSLTINSGGTLRANSGLIVRTLNISNSLTIAAGGTYTVADAGTTETHFLNIGGNFTNNGGTFTPLINNTALQVTFNGTGAQAINGTVATQTFNAVVVNKTAGTLTVSGSTTSLIVSNFTQTLGNFTAPATTTSTGGFNLTSGTYTAGSNLNVAGNFLNNGGTFTAGAGTVTLNGAGQTLGGTTSTTFNNLTINNGTVTLGRNTTSNGTLSIVIPGALALSTFNYNSNGLLSMNGALISGTGTLTLAGNVTSSSSATTSTISAPTTLSSTQTLTVGNGAATPDLSITSVVTGAAGLIKSGTGELTLSGANTFTGGVTLTDGILNINNSSALGTVAGTFTISGGTINNTSAGAITTLNYPQAWNGDFTFTGTQNLNLGTGAITPNANRLVTVNAGILTVNGAIGGGAVSITKDGAGTLLIGGSNTFTGGVNINAGILRLGNAGALNSTTPNAVTFGASSTGILQLNGNSVTISALNTNATVGSPIVEDGVVGTHTLTIDASGANTFAGLLRNGSAGTLAITKTGVGSLALSGNNAYSGSTTLSSGTLSINSPTAIGTGTFVVAGGSIDNTSAGAITLTSNNPQSWNSDFTFVGSQNLNLGTGAVTPNASRSLTINASTLTVGGVIGGGAIGISKTGNGQLTLSGANTFSGGFTLNGGVLNINNSSALGTVAGTFTINGGTIDNTTAGAISTLNYPQAWNNNFTFLGTQNLNLGSGNVSFSANRTITVSANTLTVGGAISAATFNLIKLGGGTLSFGSNAVAINSLALNAGTLTSTSGTLTVSGDFTNSGTFNNNGGTVAYNGIVPQAVASFTYNNLILSGAGQKNTSGNCTVGGNLTNSSVFDLGNNTLSVSGTINNTGGAIRFSGASNGIALNTGTVEYYGASQLITAGIYNNLTINQSSGEALLAGDVTVNGVLTLTSGRLNIGSFNLTLGSTASISVAGPTASKMIVATGGGGEVRKIFTANGTFTFPIGDNTGLSEYSPITVAVSGTGYSSAYVGVSVVDAKHPSNASAVNFLSRYWNVTQSGITAGAGVVTATYVNADISGSEAAMTTAALNGSFNQTTNPWARYLATALGSNTLTTTVAAPLISGQISAVTAITRTNPTVNIVGGGVSSCSGSPVSLTANGVGDPGFIYSWLPATGLSSAVIANPIASPTTTTVYTVTATDGNGIQASNNTTITVNPLPTLTGAIQSATVCAGFNAQIDLTGLVPGSTSTISYSINGIAQPPFAGVVANGAGQGNLLVFSLSGANNGQNLQITGIQITSSTPNCSAVFSQNVALSVDEPALITVQPIANTTLCEGASLSLTVAATGTGLTYQWRKGANIIVGATSNTLNLPSVVAANAGTYTVDVFTSGVCLPSGITSSPASTLTINTSPVITTQPIASQTVCEGTANVTFSVVATGTSLTYQWKKNGVDIGGATSASYIIPTAATGDVGTYTVQVSGTCAPSVTSTGSILTINEQPEIITVTGNQTVCEGSSVTFTVNAGATTSPTYQWRFNTTPIAGATSSSFTIPTTVVGDAGSYDVVVSGACTPSATSAASTLTINTSPAITTQPIASQTVCEGAVNTTFSVVATGTGLTYQWKKNGVNIVGATATTYTIPTAATGDAGTYTVQVSGTCAPSVTSTGSTLNINEQPEIITVTGNQTVCAGASVTFTVNAGATTSPTYQWRFNTTPIVGATNSSYTIATTTTGDAGSYDVVVSGACTPSATNTASTLTINTAPAITTQPIASQTVCEGAVNTTFSVVATGTGLVYQWKKNGVDIGGATSASYIIPTAATGDAGTHTVQVSGTCAPSVTSTGSTLNINEQPEIITVTGNQTVCAGASVTFTVNAGVTTSPTYQWRFNTTPIAGATNSSYTIPTAVVGDAGSYDVVVSGTCTPSATSTASTLTINTSPAITTQPIASQTVCEGAVNTTFSVVATGTSLTYQWKKNGVDIGGATSASYIIPTAATGDVGTYTVQVSGTCAPSVTSTGSTLNINEQPEIITVTGNQTVCAGASVTFTVNAGVTTSPTYQWRFNTTPIAGATNSSFTIPTTVVGDAGSYDVVVSGTCTPSATSAASTLTINTSPAITTQPIASQTVCEGAVNTTFSVVATGTGLTYQWKKNGVDIGGATSASYIIPTAATGDAGTYTVQVSGTCAPSVTSTGSTLNINEQPEIITVTGNQTVCAGANVTFTVNAGVTTSPTYQWRFNTNPIAGATNSSFTIPTTAVGDAGSYDVVVSGACTPSATSAASTLTINTAPAITTQPIASQTVCEGAVNTTFSVVATGTGLTYQWKKNGVDIGGATSASYIIPTAATGDAGTYTVQVSGTCAPSVTSTGSTLNINEQPEVLSVTGNQTVCAGASVTFTVNAGVTTSPTYQWRFNTTPIAGATSSSFTIPTTVVGDAGSYDVVVSGACTPSATSTASTLTINTAPAITTQPIASQTVCEGTANVTFSVVATGTGLTYQWKKNGVDIGGATSDSYVIATAATGDAGTYTVQVSGTCAPSVTSTGSVLNINEQPEIITITGNQTVCAGSSVTFTVNAGATTSPTYQWRFNTTPIAGATNSSYTIPTTVVGDAGSYDVVVSGACTPSATSAASTLTINTSPAITTQPIASQTVCEGAVNTTFSVVATGTGLTYQWKKNGVDIGGATSASYIIPTAATGDAGTYTVQLSGTCAPSVTSTGSILNINEQPEIITVTGNQTVCAGSSVTFTVNAGATTSPTYQWRFNTTPIAGATSSSYTIATTTTGDAGSYDVAVSGACTPSATSAASILTINTAPAITTQPIASQTVCEGTANVTFSVVATGTSLTYQWKKNGVDIGGATSASYIIPTAATGDVGTYTVQVSGTCAPSVTSTGSTLNINEQPEIITVTGNQTVCAGSSVTFTVNAGATTSPTYQWRFNTTPIAGATNSSYTIPTTAVGDAGSYDVVVSGACTPSATSGVSILTINELPEVTLNPSDSTICENGSTSFTVNSGATTSPTFQWQVSTNGGLTYSNLTDGGIYSGSTSNTLALTNVPLSQNGNLYKVIIGGACPPTAISSVAQLNVQQNPVIVDQPTNKIVCENTIVLFSVNSVGTGLSYQWRENGTPITNGGIYSGATTANLSLANIPATLNGNGYDVVITGTCSTTTSSLATLSVNPLPIGVNEAITICSDIALNYDLQTNINSSNGVVSTYSWVASNNLNILGESLGIQSSSAITDKLTNQSVSSQIVTYTITPTSVTGSCQGTPFTLTVTINPEPVGISQNVIQCSGVPSGITITSTAGSVTPSGFNIATNPNGLTQLAGTISAGLNQSATELQDDVWSNTGASPVNVIYTITPIGSVGGCLGDPFTITLTVSPEPVGVSQTHTVCSDAVLGSGLTLTTNGTSVSAASYTINSITFSSGSLTASAGVPVTGTGKPANELIDDSWTNQTGSAVDVIYNVSPVSSAGCVGAPFTVTVTVQPEPMTTANVVAASVCSDVVTGYTLSVVGATTYTISTNSNGLVQSAGTVSAGTGKLAGELSDDSWTNTSLLDVNVVYTITPISGVGCAGDVFTVTVGVRPEPRGVNAGVQICSNSSVSYDLQTSNIDVLGNAMASSYSWLAADNTNVTGESLIAQSGNVITNTLINTTGVDQTVVYTVTPTGTVSGCVGDNFTITVTVKPEPVGVPQTHTVCSDAVLGSGLTLTTNGTSVSAASYTINSITFSSGSLTASAGVPVTGMGKPANELIDDSWTNQTGSAVDVIYNVSPVSSAGCVGAAFIVTVTVQPEPVTTANVVAASVCSDVVTGYTLSVVGATTYTISTNSNGLVQSAGTVSAGTGKLAGELSDDSWTNTSLLDVNVVYTITPISGVGCAGDVFTVTVGVRPEPRGVNAGVQICSNSSVSYDLQTSNIDVLGNAMASSYSWLAADNTNVTGESLIAQSGNVITNTLINTTGVDQVVVYTVTPTGTVSGCVGDNFTITVTVKPEPVGVPQTHTVCSDAVLGSGLTLTTNGTSVSAASYTINSITFSSGSLTASAGVPVTGMGKPANELIDDSWTNQTGSAVDVIYNVSPVSSTGCVGAAFIVTVTVQPEPVTTANVVAASVCSDVVTGYTLSVVGATTYTISTNSNGLVQSAGTVSAGTGKLAGELSDDSWTNTTLLDVNVVYTITPISGVGCAGDVFTVTVGVRPEPRGVNAGVQICSNSSVSYDLQTSNIDVLGNAMASSYSWLAADNTNVTGESLIAQSGNVITNTLINTTGVDQVVVYTVTPTGTVSGCVGNSFMVTVTVKPEPVGVAQSATTCSDIEANYNLIINVALLGNNVGSTFTWVAMANPNATGESTSLQSGSIITDKLTNVTNSDVTVNYTVTPTSVNGCTGSSFTVSLIVKPEPVGTSLAAPTICSGSPVSYNLQGNINLSNGLASNFTWIATVNPSVSGASVLNAQTTSTITDVLVNNTFVPQVVTYTINPIGTNGCAGDPFTIDVTINPKAQVSAGPDLALCRDIPTIALQGSVIYAPNGVTWTGATGVYSDSSSPVSSYNFNNPSEINQTLVLTLTANDPDSGGPCLSVSDQMNLKINQLPSPAILTPSTSVVENAPNFTITGANAGGIFNISPGFGLSGTTITNISGNLFDVATFNPSSATIYDGTLPTINRITYTFTDTNGCTGSNFINIIVNPVTVNDFRLEYSVNNPVPFDGIDIFSICANIGKILIRGTPAVTLGLGPETSITSIPRFLGGPVAPISFDGTNYFLETDGLPSDTYRILYTYKNTFGAITTKTHDVKVFATPIAKIKTPANSCVESAIDLNDDSSMPAINPFAGAIDTWKWDFDDQNEGSNSKNTSYNYNAPGAGGPGLYNIQLDVETDQGCKASTNLTIRAGDVPVANYSWSNICTNDQTIFKDLTQPGTISTIEKYIWNFGDGDILTSAGPNATLTVPGGTHSGRTSGTYQNPTHNYTTPGPKTVSLTVQTNDGCFNTIPQTVTILLGGTTVQPTEAAPYLNNFEALVDNDWFSESKIISAVNTLPVVYGVNSWLRGVPNGSDIKTAASGSMAWWTGANIISSTVVPPTYYQNEDSWVNGPCFDFTRLERPMVTLDYWSDSELNIDGAAMQYSTDGGLTWQLIGPLAGEPDDQGINWYNEKGLPSNPGQQSFGWTGKQGKWKNARYNLDIVPEPKRSQVRVRIAFGSNDGNESSRTYDGFAFDNFFVGEKKRVVLMEHFTNSSLAGSLTADDYINDLYNNQIDLLTGIRPGGQSDFNQIQYHISYSSANSDLLNADNPNDPNTRASSYGVSQPPKTFMDGIKNAKFDGTFTKLNKFEVDRRALKDPKFTLKLDTIPIVNNDKSNYINVKMTITADTIVNVPLIAQVALVEDDVPTTTPNRTHKNVLRKLLLGSDPTKPDGITISTPFGVGDVAVRPNQPAPPNPPIETQINVPIRDWTKLKLIGFIQDKNTGEIYQSTILQIANKKVGSTIVGVEPENPSATSLNELQIYPNPANGKFNFAIPGEFPAGYIWKISDQRGVFVKKGDFSDGANGIKSVDVSDLINGVYFVLIGAEGQVPIYRKLIVMNQH